MKPTPYKSLYNLFCLSITISIIFPCFLCSSPQAEPHYAKCTQPFKCGGDSAVLGELKYPFWGINRPNYCGKPGFELKCLNNTLFITNSTYSLEVIGAYPQSDKIRVAIADLRHNNLCPSSVLNTNTTNSSIFDLTFVGSLHLDSSNALLTILYGCPSQLGRQLGWSSQFSCSINNTNTGVHFVTHTVNDSLTLGCLGVAILPVVQENAQALDENTITLPNALDQGFELGWFTLDDHICKACLKSGGQCGYDNQFTCYCPDQPYQLHCPPSKPGSKNILKIAIGSSIGAVVLLALLGGCFVFARRRRIQRITQYKTREVSAAPASSTNGLTSSAYTSTPSTTLSQTTASYTSSKSEIGREKTSYFGVHVFEYSELEHATCNFHDSKELGDGGFGTVYYGMLPDGRQVAVKRLYENSFKRVEQFMNEIRILADLQHKNLVALYGCTSRRSRELLLVYEYIPNGTVADHIHGRLAESTFLPWLIRLSIAVETAEALAYLHRNDVIHRDVKTTNILLDNDFHVKVADFGLSRLFPTDMTHVSTAPQGTPGYVDPEYYQCYKLTEKSDVYSFGVVLVELISSKHAVDVTRHRHHVNLANMALDRIQNQELHELVDPRLGFDKDHSVQAMVKMVGELGFRCLQQDRDMRPTMDEVVTTLRAIQMEGLKAQKQEVVDIVVHGDDVGLLTNPTPPLSPELLSSNDIVVYEGKNLK